MKSFEAELGASLGALGSVLGLEGRKVAKGVAHFGRKLFSVTNFRRIFLSVLHSAVFSCVTLVVVMAWASRPRFSVSVELRKTPSLWL